VLEIGSGFGTNLAIWVREFGVDGYGVEPTSPGFDAGLWLQESCFRQMVLIRNASSRLQEKTSPFPTEPSMLLFRECA